MSIFPHFEHRDYRASAETMWLDDGTEFGLEPIDRMSTLRRHAVAEQMVTLVQHFPDVLLEFPRLKETYRNVREASEKLDIRAQRVQDNPDILRAYAVVEPGYKGKDVVVRGYASIVRKMHERDLPECIDKSRPYAEFSTWLRPQGEPAEYERILRRFITGEPVTEDTQLHAAVIAKSPKEIALRSLGFTEECRQCLDLGIPSHADDFTNERSILILPKTRLLELRPDIALAS